MHPGRTKAKYECWRRETRTSQLPTKDQFGKPGEQDDMDRRDFVMSVKAKTDQFQAS